MVLFCVIGIHEAYANIESTYDDEWHYEGVVWYVTE
jgi:hypothetical protein